MMKMMMIVLLAACGTASTTNTRHDTLESVPDAAAAALRKQAGGAEIVKVEREHDGYEGSWYVDGLEHEATVTASGEVVDYEEQVREAQVPEPARATAVAKLPKGDIKWVKLKNGSFEAEVVIDGHEHEVIVAADGKVLPGEDDDDDDDDND